MKKVLFIFCSLYFIQYATAQDFVTDATLEKTVLVNDDELKILYFTATWCGPCKIMAPIMSSVDKDPKIPVTIYKMDTDSNRAPSILRIRSIPTYYFIKNGIVLGTSGGAQSKSSIEQLIAKYNGAPVVGKRLAFP